MNLVDAVVYEVLGSPVLKYHKWWICVSYHSWGITPDETELMFNTKEEALSVAKGYKFLT